MSMRVRITLFGLALAGVVLLAVPAFGGLPPFGAIDGLLGDALVTLALEQRATANTVTATMFDMRALDTLGEEAILFAAVAGTSLLLRRMRQEREEPPDYAPRAPQTARRGPATRVFGVPLIGLLSLVGLALLANGHTSPGGGFQGGVLIAGALLCIYLLHDYDAFDALSRPAVLEPVEALAIAGYIGLGVAGLATSSAFLTNVLPHGVLGRLLSGGTIPVLNVVTGIAVASGVGLILAEFAEQALRVRED